MTSQSEQKFSLFALTAMVVGSMDTDAIRDDVRTNRLQVPSTPYRPCRRRNPRSVQRGKQDPRKVAREELLTNRFHGLSDTFTRRKASTSWHKGGKHVADSICDGDCGLGSRGRAWNGPGCTDWPDRPARVGRHGRTW